MTFYAVHKTWFYDDYKRADGGGFILNLFKTEQKAVEYAKKKMVEYINENCLVFECHRFKNRHWYDHGFDLDGIVVTTKDLEEYNDDMQKNKYNPPPKTHTTSVKVWLLYKDIVKQPATKENLEKLRALKIALEGEAQYTFSPTNEDFTVVELEALDEDNEVKIVVTEPEGN
jgi:hypothetical protein